MLGGVSMEKKKGFGGWLLLFVMILPLQLFIHATYVIRGLVIFANRDFVQLKANYGESYSNLVKYSGLFIIITSTILFIAMILVNYAFFTKRSAFINMFILVNIFSVLLSFISEFLGDLISGNSSLYLTSFRLLIFLVLSITYLKKSQRVRSTFIS
jgi:uncharacterized membrane protein YdjX (TVP38/TMEM64 family)